MKAEHRKELHTNALADHLGKFVEGLKAGPKASTVALWVVGILAVGVFIAWRYHAATSAATDSALWVQLDGANGVEAYQALAKDNRDTKPARVARLQEARALYQQGIQELGYNADRARQKLEEAGTLYDQLAQECKDEPLLAQEALLGAARAAESCGKLDKALELNQKLAAETPRTFLVEAAEKRLEALKSKSVEAFYQDFDKRASLKAK
jgi:uncharacterized protein HemX